MTEELVLVKISDLPETAHVAATDIIPVVQNGITKKVPSTGIRKYVTDSLGTAAFSSKNDFEPSGSVLEVDLKSQARADEQNKRIDRIEVAAYLLKNNKVFKAYRTKALMNADLVNIPINSIVTIVSDPLNDPDTNDINGQYHYDGNDFLKLPDDILSLIDVRYNKIEAGLKDYADEKATSAIQASSLDAQMKADEAESAAISAAANDASTKASTAKSDAITVAATDASNKSKTAEDNAKAFTSSVQVEVIKAISVQIAKSLTLKQGNAYINSTGAATSVAGQAIYSFAVQPTEMYRIVNSISYLNASAAQRSYAFYSSTTISAETFISGGVASTDARTADDYVIVPANAVMLCVGNKSTLTASLYYLDLKDNETLKALSSASAKNSIVLQNRKRVRNQLDSLFESKVNFFRDLTTAASAPITTNSNTADAAYNFSPRIANEDTTNVIAYTENTDANVGYIREFNANYGSTASKLIPIGSILEKTKIIFGLRIDASVAAASLIEVSDGSGNTNRYEMSGAVYSSGNSQATEFKLLAKSGNYYVYEVVIAGSTAAAQQNCRIAVKNTTATSGTFNVGLFGVKAFRYVDNFNYFLDTPYSNTENSPFLKKNLMYFGDSQSRGNIAFEFMRQLGCNVYWNAAGSRAMKYRSGQDAASDKNWLYHWSRRQHIVNAITDGGEFALYVFNVSYNDGAGGGTLSDAAIQAVLDNYPTITDDATTVTNKLSIFNALTETQRESVFGYKQTFAAMLKQIIEYQPNAKIFLTTMLYNPQGNGTSESQRTLIKSTRDSCNADIREIASYFGVSVIDTNSNSGHYFGNMKTHVSDGLHFDEVIGKRIGYFTAKNILMQTV